MSIGIFVDSSCDLKQLPIENAGDIIYERVPLTLRVGEHEYVDNNDLDVEAFMEDMTSYSKATGSAAPSPGVWYECYQKADEVFAISLTSALSATYSSAKTAEQMILEEEPNKKIMVIDSLSAGPELALIVCKIVTLAREGKTFEQIQTQIEEYRRKTHLIFALSTLDNLMKNGKVSKLQGHMAGLVGLRLLGCASDQGTLEVIHKLRGKCKVYDVMVEEMIKNGYQGSDVYISQCHNLEKAEYIKAKLQEKYPRCQVTILTAGGLCSYYIEDQGLLLGYDSE